MARASATDFLHSFRFHVVVTGFGAGSGAQLGTGGVNPTAGFTNCTAPELSTDAVEYREGNYIYTRKQTGIPTQTDLTLSRGVALSEGTFWLWMKNTVETGNEYRANIDILHFHRDAMPATTSSGVEAGPFAVQSSTGVIIYHCYEAVPIRHKVATDLDATASEISIQEVDVAIESFDKEIPSPI